MRLRACRRSRCRRTTNPITFVPANSVACTAGSPDIGTVANTYYRVFDLPALGVTGDLTVSDISFQVEDCESANNGHAIAVRIGTYAGTIGPTLQANQITILQSNNAVQVNELDATASSPSETVDVPISQVIPVGSKMVVELDAPDGTNTYQFFVGTSNGGETGISYISAPGCGVTDPSSMSTASGHNTDILMTVSGTFQ